MTVVWVGGLILGAPAWWAVASALECTEYDGDSNTLRDGCGTPALVAIPAAIVVGLLAAAVASGLATARLRGRSDAGERIRSAKRAAFGAAAILTFFAVSVIGFAIVRG